MGEIADMMLDGTLCATCGTYIGEGDSCSPLYCSPACEPEGYRAATGDNSYYDGSSRRRTRLFDCPDCGKRFRSERAVSDHRRDAHGVTP